MLCCRFQKQAPTMAFTKPYFGSELKLIGGIHPLLKRNAVPNNVDTNSTNNFSIITGPNMSGKTVHIKMIAILQIMAQLGCYVPGTYVEFRITNYLFTCFGSTGSSNTNLSPFYAEIRTIEYILANATPDSLIIVDGLCETTSPDEGAKLATKLCKRLACVGNVHESTTNKISAPFVFLTTHYHSLTELANNYPNIINLCADADNHYVTKGVVHNDDYDLNLAKTFRFPADILPEAVKIHNNRYTEQTTSNNNNNDDGSCISRSADPVSF